MDKDKLYNALYALWNWQKQNIGSYTEQFVTELGLPVEIDYKTSASGDDYEWEWEDFRPSLTKEQRATFAMLGFDDSDIVDGVYVPDIIKPYLRDLTLQYSELVQNVWNAEDGEEILYDSNLDIDCLYEFSKFEDIWERVKDNVKVVETIQLTKDYDAIVSAGSNDVQVGCQLIDIEQIRQVVEKWDELNGGPL